MGFLYFILLIISLILPTYLALILYASWPKDRRRRIEKQISYNLQYK
nr:hypothetical protein K-LCC10_0286 [Kaumoebavirus]